jgi:hypothetical protein
MAKILRTKSPAERLEMAHSMWRTARDLIRAKVAQDHPDWTAQQVQAEAARRMLCGSG